MLLICAYLNSSSCQDLFKRKRYGSGMSSLPWSESGPPPPLGQPPLGNTKSLESAGGSGSIVLTILSNEDIKELIFV